VCAVQEPGPAGTLKSKAGLDSIWPGQTDFLVHDDCEDRRFEAWRWLTYQFSHVGLSHVGMNAFLTLFLGIALEGFHGHLPTMACFNFGVIIGALCHACVHCHSRLVGMSGGVYALFGMHVGELVLNWRQMKYRFMKAVLLMAIAVADFVNSWQNSSGPVSFSAHLGGCLIGLSIAILFGRNLKVHKYERVLQALFAVANVVVITCAVVWVSQWAPRSIWDPSPWCWARQVADLEEFGDVEWHCVRCHSQDCIERWQALLHVATVDHNACTQWSYTEV